MSHLNPNPLIRKYRGCWVCSVDPKKLQVCMNWAVGRGTSPQAAYDDWARRSKFPGVDIDAVHRKAGKPEQVAT